MDKLKISPTKASKDTLGWVINPLPHICVSKSTIIGSDNGAKPLSEPMPGYCLLDEQT